MNDVAQAVLAHVAQLSGLPPPELLSSKSVWHVRIPPLEDDLSWTCLAGDLCVIWRSVAFVHSLTRLTPLASLPLCEPDALTPLRLAQALAQARERQTDVAQFKQFTAPLVRRCYPILEKGRPPQ